MGQVAAMAELPVDLPYQLSRSAVVQVQPS